MTNREKYIDNLSNDELATKIAYRDACSMCIRLQQGINPSECKMYGANCEDFIEEWLSQESEKTADEMFEELGYEILNIKEFDTRNNWKNTCGYINKENNDVILVGKLEEECFYRKQNRMFAYVNSITEAEDKAIHKKIEEMKNDKS